MISLSGEREMTTIHGNGRYLMPVGHRNITFRGEGNQLGLLFYIQHAAGSGEGL